ncbi:hypothetical protein M3231_01815 [Neobacillus mesonae]|nr:hypothetical protein [Neobacillus mesonae]
MNQYKTNIVIGYKEKKINYSLLTNEKGSDKLAIIFPGAGYSVHKPLLHYSTQIFVNRSLPKYRLEIIPKS